MARSNKNLQISMLAFDISILLAFGHDYGGGVWKAKLPALV
jgi:hypothetical protein